MTSGTSFGRIIALSFKQYLASPSGYPDIAPLMKSLYQRFLALALLLGLPWFSALAEKAELTLDDTESYTVTVYYYNTTNIYALTPGDLERLRTHELKIFKTSPRQPPVAALITALKNNEVVQEASNIDVIWGVVFLDRRGQRRASCFLDRWYKYGFCNGRYVRFGDDFAKWARQNLAAAFDLDDPSK